MQENRRLAFRDSHLKEKRWDIVIRGFQNLEDICREVDFIELEPLNSFSNHPYLLLNDDAFTWFDVLQKEAEYNNERFHIFSVDIENKKILHSTTSDPEEVEVCEVDMT